jgi:single-stranded-DNA-specific exonuclease
MLESPAFLNVETSVTGRRWLGPTPEIDRVGRAIGSIRRAPRPSSRRRCAT